MMPSSTAKGSITKVVSVPITRPVRMLFTACYSTSCPTLSVPSTWYFTPSAAETTISAINTPLVDKFTCQGTSLRPVTILRATALHGARARRANHHTTAAQSASHNAIDTANAMGDVRARILQRRVVAPRLAVRQLHGLFHIEVRGKGRGIGLLDALPQRGKHHIEHAQYLGCVMHFAAAALVHRLAKMQRVQQAHADEGDEDH